MEKKESLCLSIFCEELKEEAKTYMYTEKEEDWEKFVERFTTRKYNGTKDPITMQTLAYIVGVMRALETSDFKEAYINYCFIDYKIYDKNRIKKVVSEFSKKGPEFYEFCAYTNGFQLTSEEVRVLQEIRSKNQEYEENQLSKKMMRG